MNTQPSNKRKGMGLAGVLVLTALASMLLLTLANLVCGHLARARNAEGREQALLMAESALRVAARRVLSDNTTTEPVTLLSGECEAHLSFTAGDAPYSLNNLASSTPREGYGHTMVPAHAIHLVAIGSCRGRQVVREAILHIPPFPYSIASNGRIEADRVLVGSVENLAAFENGLNPDELFPGHILSNATDSNGPALVLGAQCEVLGDARAVGSVDNHGLVRGQLRPFSEAQAIATIDPTTYDPRGQLNLRSLDSSFENRLSVAGPARRQGDMIVGDGLDLDGGLLYVDGDLVVHGGIRGQGAVVCTGRLEVNGGSQLTSTGLTALVAGGDVTLHGEGSVFTGLVATQGGFSADNLEVRGVLLAQGDMHLEDTRLYYVPEAGHIELGGTLEVEEDPQAELRGLSLPRLQLSDFADGQGGYAWDPSKLSIQWSHPDGAGSMITETFSDWRLLPPGPIRRDGGRFWSRVESDWRSAIDRANQGHSRLLFRLDLDQLLSAADRLRIVLWRSR